jgi:hypothetical protein
MEQAQAPLPAGACVVMRGSERPAPLELAWQAAERGMGPRNRRTRFHPKPVRGSFASPAQR